MVAARSSDNEHASDDAAGTWSCPIPMSHDRFGEAHYFLHQMEEHYHDPQRFRYNLNAFIAALRAVHEMLQRELERKGEAKWWKERSAEFREDQVLNRFARGRNIALHQRALVEGSQVTVGLFRFRRLKMAFVTDVHSDEPSAALLERLRERLYGFMVDEKHTAIGEELGVLREYLVKGLSDSEDALRASRRALARTTHALSEAHNRFDALHEPASDDDVLDEDRLLEVMVLLESDVDPDAPVRWGWVDDD